MTNRSLLVKDIFQNGKNGTWDDYAIKYDIKDAKTANDYYRWFIKNGSVENQWEPGLKEDNSQESEPQELFSEDLLNSSLWKEFINFRKSKQKEDFTPGSHLILPCVHAPFENKRLMDSCLKLISDIKPKGLHIIGDFLDMNSLSSHDKGNMPIPGVTLDKEYEEGNILLNKIIAAGNFETKSFIAGNHEHRYFKHMAKSDNAKYGAALPSPFDALRLKERGFDVETDWQQGVIYLGKYLELCHGNFYNIHSAKKHIDVYRTSVIYAHTHPIQSYIEGGTGGFNIGWMGDDSTAAFSYASRSQRESWNNGFAIVDIDENGYYFVNQIIWYNNKFYYGGKKY